jgi:hypothetical protein
METLLVVSIFLFLSVCAFFFVIVTLTICSHRFCCALLDEQYFKNVS